MNIVEAIKDDRFFRPVFKDLDTWKAWIVLLKALFAIEMTKEEFEDAVNKTDEGIKKLGDFTEEKTKEYVEWQKGLLERLK